MALGTGTAKHAREPARLPARISEPVLVAGGKQSDCTEHDIIYFSQLNSQHFEAPAFVIELPLSDDRSIKFRLSVEAAAGLDLQVSPRKQVIIALEDAGPYAHTRHFALSSVPGDDAYALGVMIGAVFNGRLVSRWLRACNSIGTETARQLLAMQRSGNFLDNEAYHALVDNEPPPRASFRPSPAREPARMSAPDNGGVQHNQNKQSEGLETEYLNSKETGV